MADGVIHRCTKENVHTTKIALYAKQSQKYQGVLWCFINAGLRKRIFQFRLEKKKMPVFYDGQNSKVNNRTSL